MLTGEILLSGLEKFAGLLNHGFDFAGLDGLPYFIIRCNPFLKSREEPLVILGIKHTHLGKVFSKSSVNASVLPESQILLIQERLCYVEHGVIGSSRCELGMAVAQKLLRSNDGFFSFLK